MIKGGQSADNAAHDGHRVRVAAEAVEKGADLFMHHGVALDRADEGLFLLSGRELPVQQQVARLEVITVFGQLIDGVAAVQQYALATIDIGDLRLTGSGGDEPRIVGEHVPGSECTHVDHVWTEGAGVHGEFNGFVQPVYFQGCFFVAHERSCDVVLWGAQL